MIILIVKLVLGCKVLLDADWIQWWVQIMCRHDYNKHITRSLQCEVIVRICTDGSQQLSTSSILGIMDIEASSVIWSVLFRM